MNIHDFSLKMTTITRKYARDSSKFKALVPDPNIFLLLLKNQALFLKSEFEFLFFFVNFSTTCRIHNINRVFILYLQTKYTNTNKPFFIRLHFPYPNLNKTSKTFTSISQGTLSSSAKTLRFCKDFLLSMRSLITGLTCTIKNNIKVIEMISQSS